MTDAREAEEVLHGVLQHHERVFWKAYRVADSKEELAMILGGLRDD